MNKTKKAQRNIWSQERSTPQGFLTVVLVLVQPFVAIVCEQLVLSKRCVNEAVHEGGGQIHTSRVHLGAAAAKPCRESKRDVVLLNNSAAVSTPSLLKTLL